MILFLSPFLYYLVYFNSKFFIFSRRSTFIEFFAGKITSNLFKFYSYNIIVSWRNERDVLSTKNERKKKLNENSKK